jgi:acetyltransferase-like isoleucine patch superfamily enzyme
MLNRVLPNVTGVYILKTPLIKRISDKLGVIRTKYNIFYHSKTLKNLGANVKFYGKHKIISPEKITIGDNCSINDYAFLHGAGSIVIKDNVTISAYAKIISTGLDLDNWARNSVSGPFKKHIEAPIFINTGAWIGTGVIILPGVEISGVGVVVAAGAIVTKSIKEDYVLYGGIPARKIKTIKIDNNENE